MTSHTYFIQKVLPLVKRNIRTTLKPFGRLNSLGSVNKKTQQVSFNLLDFYNPMRKSEKGAYAHVIMHGFRSSGIDPEAQDFVDKYSVRIYSPYYPEPQTKSIIGILTGNPTTDAKNVLKSTIKLIQEYMDL